MQFALPESPRWLVLSGAGRAAARKALVATKGNIDDLDIVVDSEISDMQKTSDDGKSGTFDFSKLLRKKNIQPLYIGLSLMFFQQITGQPSVLYYAAKIFQDAGFAGEQAATGEQLSDLETSLFSCGFKCTVGVVNAEK